MKTQIRFSLSTSHFALVLSLFAWVVLSAAVSPLRAALVFNDSFNYSPVGSQLFSAGSPSWYHLTGTTDPTISANSLTYPGLMTASGDNSVLLNGTSSSISGVSMRQLDKVYNIGNATTLYYSLTLKVNSIAANDWGGSANWLAGSYMMGFDQKTNGAFANGDAAAPLLIRTGDPNNASGNADSFQSYQLGTGVTQTSPGSRVFDGTHNYNAGATLFIVISYTFGAGANDDVAKLYVNPVPGSLESGNTPVIVATGVPDVNNNQIAAFFLRNNSVEPASSQVDNLLIGTTWADVTPPPGLPISAKRIKSLTPADGGAPFAPVIEGSDGFLYGTTLSGGAANVGTVFKVDKNGTNYTVIHSFAGGPTDGAESDGVLVEATDGALYGTTTYGGSADHGTVFKLNKDGSGFALLHSFNGVSGDGSQPDAGLIEASDGMLYGTTALGGTGGTGAIFRMNKNGTGYSTLVSLAGSPGAALKEGSDGKLYGTAGPYSLNGGFVFRLNKDGSGFTGLHTFTSSDGYNPQAPVIEGSDGALYGTTYGNPSAFYPNTVFKLNKDGSGFVLLHSFATFPSSDSPSGALLEASDGFLYGTATRGGSSGVGSVFRIKKNGTGFETVYSFSGSGGDGSGPDAALIVASDGSLYTTTAGGGDLDWGTIFKFSGLLQVTVPASATEGDGILAGAGHVRITSAFATNVTVLLSSSDTNQATVPPSLVIPAGQTTGTFNVTIVDDLLLDGTQAPAISAWIPSVASGSAAMSVFDNETATLGLVLPASATEGQGSIQGTVQVSAPVGADVAVALTSSNTNLITVPASVLIPAGQTSAIFTATVTTEKPSGGDQTATVSAHVANWTDGSAIITIHERPDHFQWSAIGSPQFANRPFTVTITAKDEFNLTVSNFTGTVALSGSMPGGTRTNTILPSPSSQGSVSGGPYSLGYSFVLNSNITVTAARHYYGSKVSIWTDSGTLLATQNVTSVDGTWVETPLATPVQLLAGNTYRVAVLSTNGTSYYIFAGTASFPDGTATQSLVGFGDVFPDNHDSGLYLVDLKYTAAAPLPIAISPTVSASFTNGAWTGNIAVLQPATNLTLLADDLTGHTGKANLINVISDTNPPVITCPANLVVTNTPGQCSAVVTYNVTATDNCAVVSLNVNPPSGSVFQMGTNLITCIATDCGGNSNTCSFTVTVLDRQAPVLNCPTNQTLVCNSTNGAQAFFTATATDNCDANPAVVCAPASGSYFALGTNTVTCVATDTSGNSNTCTFTITVEEIPLLLTIIQDGTNVVLSWPQSCAGYSLEHTDSLDPAPAWSPITNQPTPSGNSFLLTLPVEADSRFFRLRQN